MRIVESVGSDDSLCESGSAEQSQPASTATAAGGAITPAPQSNDLSFEFIVCYAHGRRTLTLGPCSIALGIRLLRPPTASLAVRPPLARLFLTSSLPSYPGSPVPPLPSQSY